MLDLKIFASEHGLRIVSIQDLVEYRMTIERLVTRIAETRMPIRDGGEFAAIAYRNEVNGDTHMALVKGEIRADNPVLVRVHSECLTGDVFHTTSRTRGSTRSRRTNGSDSSRTCGITEWARRSWWILGSGISAC
jgi:hypothetical protein